MGVMESSRRQLGPDFFSPFLPVSVTQAVAVRIPGQGTLNLHRTLAASTFNGLPLTLPMTLADGTTVNFEICSASFFPSSSLSASPTTTTPPFFRLSAAASTRLT